MDIDLKEPSQKISPDAIKYWKIVNIMIYTTIFCLMGIFYLVKGLYGWPNWWNPVLLILIVIFIISFVIEYFYIPKYKQRTWRYEINENSIQLKYGRFLKKSYKVIPMNKVYYVNTHQHLLLKKYNLSTVQIGTIAYIHEIPALPEEEAKNIRKLISELSGNTLI